MNSTFTSGFRNLFAIGILLFLITKNFGNAVSDIFQDIFSLMKMPFWVSFFSCELLPMAIMLVTAYFISNKTWHRVSTGIEKTAPLTLKLS